MAKTASVKDANAIAMTIATLEICDDERVMIELRAVRRYG